MQVALAKLHTKEASTRSAEAQRELEVTERRANLQVAMAKLNEIAAMPWTGAPESHATFPPSYALYSVHSSTLVEHIGELVRLVPAYRTVRGFDEKNRRHVTYQTLVHEHQPYRTVVDRTITYHLTLRRRSEEEIAARARDAAAAQAHACLASEDPSCAPPSPLLPSSLLHVIISISTDRDGFRAVSGLRSASKGELEAWWAVFLAKEHDQTLPAAGAGSPKAASASFAQLQAQSLAEHESYYRTIQARLQGQPPLDLSALKDGATREEGRIRVMSANIFNFNYWHLRKDLVRDALHNSSKTSSGKQQESIPVADFVGFQEVRALRSDVPGRRPPHRGERMQVTDLSAMLPNYEFVFRPAMGFRESGGEFVQEGLAIFSAFPLTNVGEELLQRDQRDEGDFHQRLLLHARAITPWGPINILTTHLSLSAEARKRTIPQLGRFALRLLPEPSVLVGDFNAPAEAEPQLLLASPFNFRDAWIETKNPNAEESEGWTFHAWERKSRIDLVLTNSRGDSPRAVKTGASDSAASTPPSSSSGHLTNPSLTPISLSILADTPVSISARGWGELELLGGVTALKDQMFPSDHLFPMATFKARKWSEGERVQSEEERKEVEAKLEQQAIVAAFAAQEAKLRLKTAPLDASKPQPLVGGIGLKDEL